MKKIMIALLAIAVLFGFAACDNSSSTPSDNEQSTELSAQVVESVAKAVGDIIKGTSSTISDGKGMATVFAADILESDNSFKEGYSCVDPYTTLTYTYTVDADSTLQDDSTVTITLTGRDKSAEATKATKRDIILEGYSITFSIDEMATTDLSNYGNYVTTAGVVSGDIVGSIAVTIAADGKVDSITPSVTSIILPDTVAVTYNGVDVDSESLIAQIGLAKDDTTVYTAASYKTAKEKTEKTAIKGYIDALLLDATSAESSIFTNFLADVYKTDGTVSTAFSSEFAQPTGTGVATATITYKDDAADSAVVAKDATSGETKALKIAKGTEFTLTLTSDSVAQTAGSFDATSYEISGTFLVYSDAAGTTANTAFDKIVVTGLKGKLGAGMTVTGNATDGVATLASGFTFEASADALDLTAGTVTADVKTAVGPGLVGTGVETALAPLGNVTFDCAKDY